ncbi:hypothetical protein GKR72_11670 [Providencia stuartii]|uniref:Uncharacterized protein n=9 Tax=Morganellaceae TaxID=1903414 RepID=A0AA86YZQ6_PROST|nr:hypothetical protein [Providencia stuartii]EDU61403.1 hypothetical protein PROSTU_00593 [Providencia stuartii ATCC 25827]MTC81189.1 hypothetical protein [Providencia stuartii]MTC93685.1 hypothetical protein [Providencia stuartii]
MEKVEEDMLTNFKSEMILLLKNKLNFFLNSRAKEINMSIFSFEKDTYDESLYLKLKIKNHKCDLIRWTDDYHSFDDTIKRMESAGYSSQDIDIINVVLSRFGYIFRVETKKKTNRDLKLFFFILQMNKISNSDEFTDEIKTELLQSFLCELFLHYETFSRFKYIKNKIFFLSDNLGYIDFLDAINEIHDRKEDIYHGIYIKLFHTEILKYISFGDSDLYKELEISFNDRLIEHLNPVRFINLTKKNESGFFSILNDITEPLQSTQELFISNLILINYTFFILKKNVPNIIELRKYINNDEYFIFIFILKLIINRTIMLPKSKLINIGLSDCLAKINDSECEHLSNVLTELIYDPPQFDKSES